jgi:hypothetical protein
VVTVHVKREKKVNPLNVDLNPICHLLALLGAPHIFHFSGLRVKGRHDRGGKLKREKEQFICRGVNREYEPCYWG